MDKVKALLALLQTTLTGEPARIIGYGGAVVIYIVAKASGAIPDQTPEQALGEAGAALVVVGTFVESIRHFVYSPNSVAALLSDAADSTAEPVPVPETAPASGDEVATL